MEKTLKISYVSWSPKSLVAMTHFDKYSWDTARMFFSEGRKHIQWKVGPVFDIEKIFFITIMPNSGRRAFFLRQIEKTFRLQDRSIICLPFCSAISFRPKEPLWTFLPIFSRLLRGFFCPDVGTSKDQFYRIFRQSARQPAGPAAGHSRSIGRQNSQPVSADCYPFRHGAQNIISFLNCCDWLG